MSVLELKVPPVIVVALSALAMWLVAWAMPAWRVAFPGYALVAIALVIVGGAVSAAGVVAFRRARTTVNPMKPRASTALVATGIYRHSRNPMYLGFALALLGWAVFLGNPLSLIVLPLFVLYMNRFQIEPEEKALKALFGAAFERYCERVRRWV